MMKILMLLNFARGSRSFDSPGTAEARLRPMSSRGPTHVADEPTGRLKDIPVSADTHTTPRLRHVPPTTQKTFERRSRP